jgi:phenylpropionate dioxygenase-like ring-hydroxylating dioxygenase large terminal subunit
MDSQISPSYYFKKKIFKKENKLIFAKLWICVGFEHDFKNDNDFITIMLSNKPIVVQRIKGEVKAFLNICSHRFSKIQIKDCGNRPLICPYHGWAYSKEGIPIGIPKKPLFKNYSKSELEEMKLTEYRVEKCGKLYFITLNEKAPSLKDYLGRYYNDIEHITNSLGIRLDINNLKIKSNWKIIIENTMEAYHLSTVHKETLAKLMPITTNENLNFSFDSPHSFYTIPLLINGSSKKLEFINHNFSERKYKIDGFIHYLIFPNLLISSSYGTTFNVSIINPISESKSNFQSNVFLAKLNNDVKVETLKDYVENVISYNRNVFDEDKLACESVQEVVNSSNQRGVLSLEEKRVHIFQQDYLKYI